jgi:NAD(P)-dependent dehydrogenase (short-subunit alcohol dehydrogenase family)
MRLSKAHAVVTGGASGLGLAVATRLASAGAKVAVLDRHEVAPAHIAELIGSDTLYLYADVSSESAVERAIAAVAERFGEITLAVNCAGVVQTQRVVGREQLLSQAAFAQVINVNLIGTFNVCRTVAKHMQDNEARADGERGVIVNTASIAAFEGQIGQAAYAASKGGIASLTLPLAREFASFGVRVMAVAPGLFDTPMMAGLPENVRQALGAQVPFPKRLGLGAEFAELVCHIYENPMLNGAVIRLDGALRMPPK